MMTIRLSHPYPAAAAILGFALFATPSYAQLGGLIKKKASEAAGQTAAKQAPATPPVFDDVTLELTDEVLAQVIAGKEAGNEFKRGPNGPAAVRARWEDAEARYSELTSRNANVLDAWNEKRSKIRACRDSAFEELNQRRREEFTRRIQAQDQALLRRFMAITQEMQAAQQRGDTAAVARLDREARAFQEPTPADSAQVTKVCGDPNAGPPIYAQVQKLNDEKEALRAQMQEAEMEVGVLERHASKLSEKQLAIACERIKDYLNKLRAKRATGGFSEAELAALDKQIKRLEDLCD